MVNYIYSILLSIFLSGLIGYERESQNKPAGLRDTILVCLGATIFTLISLVLREANCENLNYDYGRIPAYIIAGIGFLGSGVILQAKGKVEGITTATMLWVVCGMGILCGLGEFILAIISAISVYLILKLKHIKIKIETQVKKRRK